MGMGDMAERMGEDGLGGFGFRYLYEKPQKQETICGDTVSGG